MFPERCFETFIDFSKINENKLISLSLGRNTFKSQFLYINIVPLKIQIHWIICPIWTVLTLKNMLIFIIPTKNFGVKKFKSFRSVIINLSYLMIKIYVFKKWRIVPLQFTTASVVQIELILYRSMFINKWFKQHSGRIVNSNPSITIFLVPHQRPITFVILCSVKTHTSITCGEENKQDTRIRKITSA